jgi:DNA polymerase-1
MAKWLLVDGFNMMFRAFHGLPELTRADGYPTGAMHGWVKTLWRLQDLTKPDGMLVFFDLGGAQDRLALHPEYKAHRTEMPEPLQRQITPIKALTRAMGLVGVEQDGVESDDVLASQAVMLAAAGHEVLVVSSDKDFAQIVGGSIKVLLPPPTANPKLGWRMLDAAGVREKFGVPPECIADYLALVGDTSDNIRGVEGVGPKTAAKWLAEFGTLEGVIAHAGELKPERFRTVVAETAVRLRLNRQLTTLNLSCPTVTAEKRAVQTEELFRLLAEFEMKGTLADAEKRYRQAELF